jgi:adenosylcobinamide kinase/adenosylcobinamide-phosphate guanylyltransferase
MVRMALTLIIGGARSGKSTLAERLAAASGRDVCFIATLQALDHEMRARIDAHRGERPAAWHTIESPIDVPDAVREAAPGSFVIIDCLTLWVSNLMLERFGVDDDPPVEVIDAATSDVLARVDDLLAACGEHDGEVAIVTNEAGMGVVPAYALGRAFRDALGLANRGVAAPADRVLQVSAGLVLDLKQLGARPIDGYAGGAGQW